MPKYCFANPRRMLYRETVCAPIPLFGDTVLEPFGTCTVIESRRRSQPPWVDQTRCSPVAGSCATLPQSMDSQNRRGLEIQPKSLAQTGMGLQPSSSEINKASSFARVLGEAAEPVSSEPAFDLLQELRGLQEQAAVFAAVLNSTSSRITCSNPSRYSYRNRT